MGVAERRAREKQDLRAKILDAARELFIQEGYDAVTLRKIAARIEYSATTIYLHFADKAAILRELCQTDFRALAAGFVVFAGIADPIERIQAAGRAYAEFGLTHPNQYRFMFMVPFPEPEGPIEDKGNPERDAYAFLKLTVEEAIAGGRVRPEYRDAELLAQVLWATIHGVISLEITHAKDTWVDWRPVRDRVGLAIDAMLVGLALPPPGTPGASAALAPGATGPTAGASPAGEADRG